ALAGRPGYSFYIACARDTLGHKRRHISAPPSPDPAVPGIESARRLAVLGQTNEAAQLLSRWSAGDARLGAFDPPRPRSGETWLSAAGVAYAAGSVSLAMGLSDRAARAFEDAGDRRAVAVQAWIHPMPYAHPVHKRPSKMEPALLWSVMRQESRFDPRARSSSDALGLMQLKLSPAAEVARRLGDHPPVRDEDLFDPARNVRWGAGY